MPDFGFDTSTFPKVQPYDPLGSIGKLQGIEGQDIANRRANLQLMNDRYQHVAGYFSRLLGQEQISDKDIADRAQELVKAGIMTPEQYSQHVSSVPSEASIKRQYPNATPDQISAMGDKQRRNWLTQQALKAEDNHNAMNFYLGEQGAIDTGQRIQGTLSNRLTGRFNQPVGPSYPKEIPPTTPTINESNQFQLFGNQPPPANFPGQKRSNRLPVQNNSPVNPPIVNGQFQNLTGPIIQRPIGPISNVPPTFEEGKKQYSEDIANASSRLQALKPAQQALKLMNPEIIKGLSGTGPIAEKTTKILSALQGVGLLKTTEPVAARQELVKKLAQYVGNNPVGQRSDAAQTLAEAGSPNPNVQVLPALVNLTRDSIALDRVNAAKSLSFKDKDYSNYLSHKGNFPNTIDERAFKLDLMPEKEREETISKIEKESKSSITKFRKSYQLAKQLGMLD